MGFAFEYDSRRAASNLQKHGVSFREAMTVFDDPQTFPDESALRRRIALHHDWFIITAFALYSLIISLNATGNSICGGVEA
ncbi:MAG TPA: hypothetical protein VIJ79_00305 [Acidobacteriaceae bacterium]